MVDVIDSGLTSVASRFSLYRQRQARLRATMQNMDCEVLLILDAINIQYATGATNMSVFTTRTPARYLLMFADGPSILFDYRGGEHLAEHLPTIDDVRLAQGLCYVSTNDDVAGASRLMAAEVASIVREQTGRIDRLAVDRFPFAAVDALRHEGFTLADSDPVLDRSRRVKLPIEIEYMRAAMTAVEDATRGFEQWIRPGVTEMEAWSHFHQPLIAQHGQYTVTRLMQAGRRTFPYFQECSDKVIEHGDLVCLDTDSIALEGYAVDFSRSFLAGDARPSADQRMLYGRALEQLQHNLSLVGPGVSFADAARRAWPVPDEHRASRYYTLGHGLGMSGEYPNVPFADDGTADYPLDDGFEPGMVFCVESYVGSEAAGQGVKLEDQVVITETGVEVMSTYPFDQRLG